MADIAETLNALTSMFGGNPADTAGPPRWQRILGATLPEVGANVATAIPDLYTLIDKSPVLASAIKSKITGVPITEPAKPFGLPGAQAAEDFSNIIHEPVREFSNKIAGEPISDNLLNGDLPQLAGAWARLGTSALLPAPTPVMAAFASGIQKLEQGTGALAKTGEIAMKSLEAITPVLMRPQSPASAAVNFAVPAAAGVGLELAFPEAQNKDQLDAAASKASDIAVSGAQDKEAAAKAVHPVQAGGITGDPLLDLSILGVAAVAGAAAFKRDAAKRIVAGLQETDESRLGLGRAARANSIDSTDPIKTSYFDVANSVGNPNAENLWQRFSGKVDESTGAAISTKMQSVQAYGEMPGSAVKFVPLNDIGVMTRQLDPQQARTLIDAMNARRELDIRERIAATDRSLQIGTPGQYGTTLADQKYLAAIRLGILDETKTAYSMHGGTDPSKLVTGAELRQRWDAGQADPQVKKILDAAQLHAERMLDYQLEQGNIERGEWLRLKAENPHNYMTQLAQGYSHLAAFNPKAGAGLIDPGNPLLELPKYTEKVIRTVEWNKIQRTFLNAMERARDAGDPVAKEIVGRTNVKIGPHNADTVVQYRNHGGVLKNLEVKDALVRRALKEGEDMSRLHMMNGFMSNTARILEHMATGVGTIAFGPFAPVTMLYSAGAGSILRKPGVALGLMDAATQAASKGKFGYRGDLTVYPLAIQKALSGAMAVTVQRIARTLHNSVLTDGRIARMMGPVSAQATADALTNQFKRNWIYQLQQGGHLGPAVGEGVNWGRSLGHGNAAMSSYIAQHAGMMRKVGIGVDAISSTFSFVREIVHAFGASPQGLMLDMNKGKNRDFMNYMIRDLTGDPGRAGSFRGLGRAAGEFISMTPWGNPALQATDKFAREFFNKKTFLPVMTGITLGIGFPAAMVTLRNASLPDYVDPVTGERKNYSQYQFHGRSPDTQASSTYIALPGLPPENGMELKLTDPAMRPLKWAVELLTAHQIGALTGELFKPENDEQRQSLAGISRSRWASFGEHTVFKSAMEQAYEPPVIPIVGAAAAAAGLNIRNYTDISPQLDNKDAGFTEATARDPARYAVFGMQESAASENIVRSIGATVGQLVYNMFGDAVKRAGEGQSAGEIAKNAGQTYVQHVKDATKGYTGNLFSSYAAISPSQDAASTLMSEKVKGMKQVLGAFQDIQSGRVPTNGLYVGNGRRGFQELLGGPIAIMPQDPRFAPLAFAIQHEYQIVEKAWLGPNRDDYLQRQSLQTSTKYSPDVKRAMMNDVSNRIIERNRAAAQELQRFELAMSQQFGVSIRLDQMKLGKSVGE